MLGTVHDIVAGLDPEPLIQVDSHDVLGDELEIVEVLTLTMLLIHICFSDFEQASRLQQPQAHL